MTPQRDELKAKQSGTTITAALVDELSQEAEAGYDLTRAETPAGPTITEVKAP